jgi:hypothetical protein
MGKQMHHKRKSLKSDSSDRRSLRLSAERDFDRNETIKSELEIKYQKTQKRAEAMKQRILALNNQGKK